MTNRTHELVNAPTHQQPDVPAPLGPEETARLTEFARACKAAARAVLLYPAGHPAIAATVGRIVQLTSAASLTAPLRVSVLADGLMLDGRAPVRVDSSIGELAALFHAHLVGEITIHPGGDVEAWRSFLLLLGRSTESVRAEGGIARLWATMAGRHVELREIDYADVLRERATGAAADWEEVIANCLQGDAFDLNEQTIRRLLEVAGDAVKLGEVVGALDARAAESGLRIGQRTAALMRLLQGIVEAVKQKDPEGLDPVMRNIATALGQLSPDMMLAVLAQRGGEQSENAGLVNGLVDRMSDGAIADFVARNALAEGTSIDRVAQAFQTLVRDADRNRLLSLARDAAAESPLGSIEGFEEAWENVAQKLMTSYSDKPFVSEEYARELSFARTKAIEVDHVTDDPPERRGAWLRSVAPSEVQKLDITLVLDLLRIEPDTEKWTKLRAPVLKLLNDLLMVGDFDAANQLTTGLIHEMRPEAPADRRQSAMIAVDELVQGEMMRHIVTHLATIDDAHFQPVKEMCVSLGEVLIRPLAEALSTEQRPRTRERLTAILIAFGAKGRSEVERLKSSPNAAVRRTAIYLLREFGGSEALPELTELLNDSEQQVQREAVRAILNIGTERAYKVLEQALTSGTARSRELIMQSLNTRDEHAAPLFAYILRHVDHRGELAPIYLRAIEALGALKQPEGVPVLKEALYRGEWWAPRRTAALRSAVANALARIGTPEAVAVLQEALAGGPRGVRGAVRPHLAQAGPTQPSSR
jgi:hypothetical protein